MFFPSTNLGWAKTNVLVCADAWSRYCGVYAIDTKRKADVLKAMTDFLADFASMGHVPRRILADKGSDMKAAYTVMERYRQAQDGDKPMVLHTVERSGAAPHASLPDLRTHRRGFTDCTRDRLPNQQPTATRSGQPHPYTAAVPRSRGEDANQQWVPGTDGGQG